MLRRMAALLCIVLGSLARPRASAAASLLHPKPYSLFVPRVSRHKASRYNVFPLFYAIPGHRILSALPNKTRFFSRSVPGGPKEFALTSAGERGYYRDMQTSHFCVDRMKDGWDALRHYEILANGARASLIVRVARSCPYTPCVLDARGCGRVCVRARACYASHARGSRALGASGGPCLCLSPGLPVCVCPFVVR